MSDLEQCLTAFYDWTNIDPSIITDEQMELIYQDARKLQEKLD